MEDVGLLIVRVVIGLAFFGHGAQKLFAWFGGYGVKGTGGWFDSIGMKPGVAIAVFVGFVELAGGLLFAAGLFTPVVGALLAATMAVAIVKVHGPNGFWNASNGYEFPLVLLAVFVGVALTGAGAYSLDALLR
ncbi:DoxX family protein [Paenibacillus sp.]|uniref:DoxX family protein n=1 Tax=Paenibacillus sp. TaxID=58172 RepID=UPI002D64AA85|nr:DoxX family protein [Paenibacillus sp.]HZG58260.1 DoxX family protein [Paenibacillus sp.]